MQDQPRFEHVKLVKLTSLFERRKARFVRAHGLPHGVSQGRRRPKAVSEVTRDPVVETVLLGQLEAEVYSLGARDAHIILYLLYIKTVRAGRKRAETLFASRVSASAKKKHLGKYRRRGTLSCTLDLISNP